MYVFAVYAFARKLLTSLVLHNASALRYAYIIIIIIVIIIKSNEISRMSANLISRKHRINMQRWISTILTFCHQSILWYLFCQLAMLISRLYYYLVHLIAFLDTLRNISRMNFVKQNRKIALVHVAFFGVSLNAWRTYLVLHESPGRPLSDSCSRNPHWRQCKPIAALNARGLSVNKRH